MKSKMDKIIDESWAEAIKGTSLDMNVVLDKQRQDLLDIVQEECSEIIQAISKMRRFGEEGYHPDDKEKVSNKHLFAREVGDLLETLRHIEINNAQVEIGMSRKEKNLKRYKVI